MKHFFKNRLKSIRKFFSGKKSKSPKSGSAPKNESSHEYDSFNDFELLVKDNLPDTLLKEVESLNRNINESGKKMEKQGFRDGSTGVVNREQAKLKIYAITTHVLEPVRALSQGICDGLENLQKIKRENEYELHQKYLKAYAANEFILKSYLKDFVSFSRGLGVFYLVIAFILIIADIPLAVELTKEGFELDKIANKESGIAYLFIHFKQVLVNNWEVFILSSGIALCAIYFKVYYDYLIGKSPYSFILFRKYFNSEHSPSSDDIKHLKNSEKRKFWISLGLFLITVLTLIALGYFRIETIESLNKVKYKGYYQALSFSKKAALILITIIFPIIGGVCASIGLNHIFNFFHKRKHNKETNRAKEEYNSASEDLKETEIHCSTWKSFHSRLTADSHALQSKVESIPSINLSNTESSFLPSSFTWRLSKAELQISNYLMSCYELGHSHGVVNPQNPTKTNDLFDNTMELRSRMNSTNFYKKLRKN